MLDPNVAKNQEANKIFKLEPFSYMLISMDLRHLFDQNVNWVYGEDWDISISISSNKDSDNHTLTLDSLAKPVLLAEQFLSKETTKS